MAKHGIIVVAEDGTTTLETSEGIIGMTADAVTSLVAHQKAAVGYVKWIQLGLVGGLFNMLGIQSTTGKVGVGVAGKNFYVGG